MRFTQCTRTCFVAAYQAGPAEELPPVLEREVVAELDPRLAADLPDTSVYRGVALFFESLVESAKSSESRYVRF